MENNIVKDRYAPDLIHPAGYPIPEGRVQYIEQQNVERSELEAVSGYCIWPSTSVSKNNFIVNYVMEVGTKMAYPLSRAVVPDIGKFIILRNDEIKNKIASFPFGTYVEFLKEKMNGLIVIKGVTRAVRSYIFENTRMTRGIGKDAYKLFIHGLQITMPFNVLHHTEWPPGVAVIGAVHPEIDLTRVNHDYYKVNMHLGSVTGITKELLDWTGCVWMIQPIPGVSSELATYHAKAGFVNHLGRVRSTHRLMVVDDTFLFDPEEPYVPRYVFKQKSERPKYVLKGDMVLAGVYDSYLTEVKFCHTSWKKKGKSLETRAKFQIYEKFFTRNCGLVLREYLEQNPADSIQKDKSVVMIMNTTPYERTVAKKHALHYLTDLFHKRYNVILHGQSLISSKPTDFGPCRLYGPHQELITDGRDQKAVTELCEGLMGDWGRIDVVVMLTDRGQGAEEEKMTMKEYLEKHQVEPVRTMMSGLRSYMTEFRLKCRFLHIEINGFRCSPEYIEAQNQIRDTLRGIGHYNRVPYSLLTPYLHFDDVTPPSLFMGRALNEYITDFVEELRSRETLDDRRADISIELDVF
ncbi:unnamed protein product [Bursaphelenchus okinawaensis]|uniref:Uncharacterized protein n=1 Tax=Bursaphelenchus okinawaensis TaxID=465554 RepID=A0A811JV93_9BILA|nr:unnamed protein product [Bursaphelenchus okinawaensis]CAG9084015.1 unnamed protein product [Bursaphelenchus okinawaensis]